jgi:hypothetical protein
MPCIKIPAVPQLAPQAATLLPSKDVLHDPITLGTFTYVLASVAPGGGVPLGLPLQRVAASAFTKPYESEFPVPFMLVWAMKLLLSVVTTYEAQH